MKLIITNQAKKEIETTIKINNKINNKEEIAAWLIGTIKEENKELTIKIEEIHIPKQEITGTEVNINEESMIETYKELGPEKTSKIIGHWHLHGFAEKETNWSGTDETKIKDLMDKDKEIMVFLLSSQTTTKARIEIRTKCTIKGQEYKIPLTYDNIEYTTEEETTELDKRIEQEINNKVQKKTYNTPQITTINLNNWTNQKETTNKQKIIESVNYEIEDRDTTIAITIRNEFLEYLKTLEKIRIQDYRPSYIMQQEKTTKIIIKKKHKKETAKICDMLEREEYRYEVNKRTRDNIDYYDEQQDQWNTLREYDLY